MASPNLLGGFWILRWFWISGFFSNHFHPKIQQPSATHVYTSVGKNFSPNDSFYTNWIFHKPLQWVAPTYSHNNILTPVYIVKFDHHFPHFRREQHHKKICVQPPIFSKILQLWIQLPQLVGPQQNTPRCDDAWHFGPSVVHLWVGERRRLGRPISFCEVKMPKNSICSVFTYI